MGIFDKFSKKDKNTTDELADKASKLIETNQESEAEEKADKKEIKSEAPAAEKKPAVVIPLSHRRYSLLVEDAFELKDNAGVVVGGTIHGTVKNHDKVYIIHPLLPDGIEAEIDGIEDGPMNMVEEATDSRVGLKFSSITDKNKIPKYSVVTSVRPQNKPTAERSSESPFLFGLCQEFERLIKDGSFQHIFTFALFSSRYITPVKVDIDKEKTTTEKAVVKQGSKVAFKLLQHPNNAELKALPVFTDLTELRKWKNAYEGNEIPQNFFMSFEQCAEIALQNGGLVINPFSDYPVFVTNDNVKNALKVKADLDKRIAQENS